MYYLQQILSCQNRDYNYDMKFLEKLMNTCKDNVLDEDKIKIIDILKHSCKNEMIVQSALQVISNLSMELDDVEIFIENGIISIIMKCLRLHINVWMIQWLGGSALWNLCRNASARFQMRNNISFLINVLRKHKEYKKVTHTILGCLSNCALSESNLSKLSELKIFEVVDEVLSDMKHMDNDINRSLLCICGALIANSSISTDIDYKYLKYDIIYKFLNKIKVIDFNYLVDVNLDNNCIIKNSLAALHNISGCNGFKEEFSSVKGYEFLSKIYAKLITNNDLSTNEEETIDFIDSILSVYLPKGLTRNEKTTSLHICCHYNFHKVLLKLLSDKCNNLYSVDNNGNTILHISINLEKLEIITFLCAIGFNLNFKNNNGIDIHNLIENIDDMEIKEVVESAVELGVNSHMNYKNTFTSCIFDKETMYPIDLVDYMFEYVNLYKLQYLKVYN